MTVFRTARCLLLLCASLSLVHTAPAWSQETVTFRWKLPEGTRLQIDLHQATDTVTTVNKYTLRMKLEIAAVLAWNVQQVQDSGDMQIEQSIRSLKITLTPADGQAPIVFDSASDEPRRGAARQLATAVQPLLEGVTHLVLSPRGEIVAASRATQDEANEISDGGEDGTATAEMPPVVTPATLAQALRQTVIVFPAEPLAGSDNWKIQNELPSPLGTLQMENQWTYVGPEAELEKFQLQSNFKLAAPQAAALRVVEQRTAGHMRFDNQAGRLVDSEVRQHLVTQSPYRDETITVRLDSLLTAKMRPAP